MFRRRFTAAALMFVAAIAFTQRGRAAGPADTASPTASAQITRGEYLVQFGGCNDCHTPQKPTATGIEPDLTRMLSGHQQQLLMPPAPSLANSPWVWIGAGTNTAFAGPWGVSFTANLTPDKETGLGEWTPEMFIATMKTGRHQGRGRALLPPMPFWAVASLNDEDLRAVFAYLKSIPAIHNKVPAPIDPVDEPSTR